ncbi:MAG TPA: MFS transporter [Terriglobia bacterium]|nr:MFS transporter [Terriglobia bacterium]
MATTDPREVIDRSPMTTAQVVVVAITVLLNAMDGFDILSIAFASNGIAAEWNVTTQALGIVLSMELIGMAVGSVFLGGLADRIGRRPTLLGCLVTMAFGMFMATTAGSPVQLSIWRIITGLGIGGMLSCTNAVVAEFSNKKWRSLCISLMVIGYPIGGGIGGLWASGLINAYGWRSVFYLGAALTAILIPLAVFLVPESVHWLTRKQPANALARLNASLTKLGYSAVSALPEVASDERKKTLADIFSPALVRITLVVTAAYFLHIVSFYFLAKWTPRIVGAMFPALPPGTGPRVLALTNFGGAAGGALFGLLAGKVGLKRLTIVILACNAIAIVFFGRTPEDLGTLTWLAIAVGFFGNAAISGLYSIVAYAFPTHVRATGTGFVIGVGRGGAVLSPWIAGVLFDPSGVSTNLPVNRMAFVALMMAMGSLLAAAVLFFLKMNVEREVPKAGRKAA